MKKLLICLLFVFVLVSCSVPLERRWPAVQETHSVFLPLVTNQKPLIAGIEYETTAAHYQEWYIEGAPIRLSCRWSEIEQSPLIYDWSTCDNKVADNHVTLLTLKMTPAWARDGKACELPAREYWDNFVAFAELAYDRYHPDIIEIWNEPDAGGDTIWYGCLGEDGGEQYGEFISYITNHIGSEIQIAAGAVVSVNSSFVANFLHTASGFDWFTFHCYAGYYDHFNEPCVDQYDYAKTLFPNVILSETSVVYHYGDISGYYDAQLAHFRNLVNALDTPFFWYTGYYNGWPQPISTDMLGRDASGGLYPRKVYMEGYEVYYGR